MSNLSISSTYELVMQSIREAQQETYKVIQDFVKNTDQSLQRISETQRELAEQHKKTEKSIDRVSEQHKETEKSIDRVSEQQKETEKSIDRVSEQQKETEKAIDRVSEQHKETVKSIDRVSEQHKETEKALKEYVNESEKEMKKLSKQTEALGKQTEALGKQMRNLGKQMGTLGNRFGEIAEHLVFPAVVKRFNELGYNFNFEFEGNCKVRDKNNQIVAEIDVYLENGVTIAVVEVKTKPDLLDIDKHIQRIEKLKQSRKEKNEPPKILIGAIAGAIFPKEVKEAALQAGLYVLVQSGDTMKLEIPEWFKPKEF
jgi:hypothetical protein